jgi:hypothetical protein
MVKRMNKRGLSQVVTTVIIILVVLAAITLIWAAVRPTIQDASERITADCITLELEAVRGSCTIGDASMANVKVNRGPDSGTLTGLILVFGDGTTKDITNVSQIPGPLETTIVYTGRALAADDTVTVAGVVGQGNVCDVSASDVVVC